MTRKTFAWAFAAMCLSCEAVLGIAPLPGSDASADAMLDGASDVVMSDVSDGDAKDATDASDGSCGPCGDAGYTCVNGGCGNEVVDLATGLLHACVVNRAGEVWCWGENSWQECGGPGGSACLPGTCRAPAKVGGITNAVGVACALGSTCAVDATGAVFCWGLNTNQELGNDGGLASSPVQVNLPDKVTRVAGGYGMICAVTVKHDLYCWGRNECGSMGLGFEGDTDGGYGPEDFPPRLVMSGVTGVRLSYPDEQGSTCVTQTDGGASCWGFNVYGALTFYPSTITCGGPSGSEANPTPELFPLNGVTSISPGLTTCAVAKGLVYCSGMNNGNGQLGNGDYTSGTTSPTIATSLPSNETFVDVSASGPHICALAQSGQVYCWGWPNHGDIGQGYDDAGVTVSQTCAGQPCWPTATRVGNITATLVRTGGQVAYAVDDGGVWAWGWNRWAQLGHAAGTDGDHVDDAGESFNAIPTRVPLP